MELQELGGRLEGDVVQPADEMWDVARRAWNLAVDQRPVAIVYPESANDVAATVRFAAERGLRIAFNAGGHNAGPIDWSGDVLLLKTERMDGIEIDVAARMDPRSIFPAESCDRLQQAKARYDPTGLFLANHAVDLEDSGAAP